MKFPILAATTALLVSAPISGRADVGVYEETPQRPTVERRVYTERRYVEPAPVYREEVRIYRPAPRYITRVYREAPVYPVFRPVPVYRERPVIYLPPAPHRIVRHHFGHW